MLLTGLAEPLENSCGIGADTKYRKNRNHNRSKWTKSAEVGIPKEKQSQM